MRSPWSRWKERRFQLALQQVQAIDRDPTNDILHTDAITGRHYLADRAVARLINPKATTHTEWRGD